MSRDHSTELEFSRVIDTMALGDEDLARAIEANADECAALARRFGLASLESLTATLRIARLRDGLFRVRGELTADVVQSCVVTLAPLPARIRESFTLNYARRAADEEGVVVVSHEDGESPEPLLDERIDLGEAVAQQLALALDPYPRAPGARIEAVLPAEAEITARPFAALSALKGKRPS